MTFAGSQKHYEGDWADNQMHGRGVFTCQSTVYRGQYLHNLKDGYGELSYNQSVVYRGHWKNGKKHGAGIEFTWDG